MRKGSPLSIFAVVSAFPLVNHVRIGFWVGVRRFWNRIGVSMRGEHSLPVPSPGSKLNKDEAQCLLSPFRRGGRGANCLHTPPAPPSKGGEKNAFRMLMRAAILLVLAVNALTAQAQDNRRDREEPELVVEPGGRTGTCDAVVFSNDGQFLFAAGDDKVVRVWPNDKTGLAGTKMQTLRWPSWREQRGGIKALAVSPDAEHVLIGGFGLRSSTVALINRRTGEIEELTYPKSDVPSENFYAVMSAAFSPDGKAMAFGTGDGSVWLWNRGQKPKRIGKQVAMLPDGKPMEYNRIRLVAFLKSGRILSVAQTGQIQAWERDGFASTADDRGKMGADANVPSVVFRAALSDDREWLAAGGNGRDLIVYNLATEERKTFTLKDGEFIRALAFDRNAKRLAIAIGSVIKEASFSIDADDRIILFDRPTAGALKPTPGPHSTYRVDALAFDPSGRLAVAGGPNHEVVLWDLNDAAKPLSVVRGVGRNLWGVRISESGGSISFQNELDVVCTDPNKRGRGAWHGFDLVRAKPLKTETEWVEPLTTADGWTVQPDRQNRLRWWAVHDEKILRFLLPLNPDRDEAPRCFTFLKATKDQPTRLVVGHYYGCSIYDLTEQGATRRSVCIGHAGEVMSVAPSKDQKWFATCGTDQTVAGWSAEDWKYQPQLGAAFAVEDGKLLVKGIAVGSPAWEMGLIEGDEIVLMVIAAGPPLFNRSGHYAGRYGPAKGAPEDCLPYLRNPVPGQYLHLGWKRGGKDKLYEQVTSMPRRPLWRFFPSFDDKNALADWVVWMWKTSCYHTSTNGDFLVGWHVNHPSLDGTPKFYRAEQFREHFQKPPVILPLLTDQKLEDALKRAQRMTNFGALEPAPVTIEPRDPQVGPNGMELTLKVNRRGTNPDLLPERVDLWINDFRYATWSPGEAKFEQKVVIPAADLRDGVNQVTLQTFNRLGGRGEAMVVANHAAGKFDRNMYGVFVGVNSYDNSKVVNPDGGRAFGNLASAVNDALRLHDRWLEQSGQGKLFVGEASKKFLDADAKRQEILNQIEAAGKKARPDDLFVLFLAGHGDFIRPAAVSGAEAKPGVFVFCCPDYDRKAYNQTGISSEVLIGKLAQIPARKLVLLDACHSGEAASTNLVRQMTPNGKGLTIIAACDQQEQAFEHAKFKNGLFTYAVMEALGPNLDKADLNHDGRLDPDELYRYVKGRLPELLKEAGKDEFEQNPICFPREPERFPVAKK
jgi:WD40 repeat protein